PHDAPDAAVESATSLVAAGLGLLDRLRPQRRRRTALRIGALLEVVADVQDEAADVVARRVDGREQVRENRLIAEVACGEALQRLALELEQLALQLRQRLELERRRELERCDAALDLGDAEHVGSERPVALRPRPLAPPLPEEQPAADQRAE